ncbi:MAG: alpha/beta hydrolase [Alphaproteobacteria bacterium]|nr:alpha/beta hydrolase [Alphaproteobacteria bacterium]
MHGLTRMAYDFMDVAQALSAKRDVYSLSMPGRGESDWLSDAEQYIYPNYVADCLHIIKDELKLSQVDWLGTSMGGLIGMWIASLDRRDASAPNGATGPALIRKLVLNDIGPFLPLIAIQRIAFYASRVVNFNTIEEAERHCRAIYADFNIKSDKAWRFFAEKTVRAKPEGGFTLHYDPRIAKAFADVKEDVNVWPLYDAVTCPTLLLRGAKSDVLSKEIAQEMTQRGPKAKLVTFADCGHVPALMDDEQIKTVSDFLA